MLKLARWSTTHRKYVVIGWIALLIGVNVLAQSAGTSYSNNFTLPNSDSQRAADLLQHSFPAQAGDRDTIVYKVSSGTVHDPAVRERMQRDVRAGRKAPARRRRDQPLCGRVRRQADLRRRPDRLRDGRLRRKSQPAAHERARTRRGHRARGRQAGAAGGARRAGDRGDRAGRLRPVHRGRPAGRDRRAAADVRLADGDGPADRHRAVRPGHRPRRDRAVHARRRHPQLLLRARRDDRARRGHRLRAVHPHALPRGLPHSRPDVRRRARVGRAVDGHRRARRPVRGHDRRDRAARDDAAGRRLPLRRRDLGLDRRAARDARLAHAAARRC